MLLKARSRLAPMEQRCVVAVLRHEALLQEHGHLLLCPDSHLDVRWWLHTR